MSMDSDQVALTVTAGLHAGARVPVQIGRLWIVGADERCDICLADDGVAGRHVALSYDGGGLAIRSLDGQLRVNGRAVEGAVRVAGDRETELSLEPSGVTLRIGQISRDSGIQALRSDRRPSRRTMVVFAALMVASILVVSLSVAASARSTPQTSTPSAQELVQSVIDDHHLADDVEVAQTGAGLTVRGLTAKADLASLREALRSTAVPITYRIRTVEELLGEVEGVFLANGYAVRIRYAGSGEVVVENLDGGNAEIQRIAAFVRADVAGLRALRFLPSAEPESAPVQPAIYRAPPGKRLTTVVDGKTAYIATEDGARYFPGSVLPSGHRIRKITARGVQVDHNNTISWLQF